LGTELFKKWFENEFTELHIVYVCAFKEFFEYFVYPAYGLIRCGSDGSFDELDGEQSAIRDLLEILFAVIEQAADVEPVANVRACPLKNSSRKD